MTLVRRWQRVLAGFFDLTEPEPPRLNCGCLDVGARYVCDCGHATCEQHRPRPARPPHRPRTYPGHAADPIEPKETT